MLLASFRRNAALGVVGTAVAVLLPLASAVAGTEAAHAAPAVAAADSVKAGQTKQAAKANRALVRKKRELRKAKRIVKVASRYKGRPYRWGAAGPRAFDCSGYTQYVVRKATGKYLPHNSHAQSRSGKVDRVNRANKRVGDLVFFGGRSVHHVGIYAGKGRMWHSPKPGSRVKKADIYSSNVSFGRVV